MLQGRLFFLKRQMMSTVPAQKVVWCKLFYPDKNFFRANTRKNHVFQVGHMEWIVISTKIVTFFTTIAPVGIIYYCHVQNILKTGIKVLCYTIFMKLWIMSVPVSFDNYRHVSFRKKVALSYFEEKCFWFLFHILCYFLRKSPSKVQIKSELLRKYSLGPL